MEMLASVTDKPLKGLGLPVQKIIYHLIKSKKWVFPRDRRLSSPGVFQRPRFLPSYSSAGLISTKVWKGKRTYGMFLWTRPEHNINLFRSHATGWKKVTWPHLGHEVHKTTLGNSQLIFVPGANILTIVSHWCQDLPSAAAEKVSQGLGHRWRVIWGKRVESGRWEVWAARKQCEQTFEDVHKVREVALNLRLRYSSTSAQLPDLFLSGSYTQALAWKASKGLPRPAVMRDQLCT